MYSTTDRLISAINLGTGQPQTYFHGAHYGERMCRCHEDGTCRKSAEVYTCNCDVMPQMDETFADAGVISNATGLLES